MWHWDNQLRPHLTGLTDAEYLWEPAGSVATSAWRLAHITVGVLGRRTHDHFGGPKCDEQT